jgi:polyphosphate kinase
VVFRNGDAAVVYCSSADWMERNFFRRVKSRFPSWTRRCVTDRADLKTYLDDTADAWCRPMAATGAATRIGRAFGAGQLLEHSLRPSRINTRIAVRLAQAVDLVVQVSRRQRMIAE